MRMNKSIQALMTISVILVLVMTAGVLVLTDIISKYDKALAVSGYTTVTINATDTDALYSNYDPWTTATHQDTAVQATDALHFGYGAHTSTPNEYRVIHTIVEFDISGVPDIDTINDIRILVYCLQLDVNNDPEFQAPYFSIYDTSDGGNGSITVADNDNFNDGQQRNRISDYHYWTDLNEDEWFTLTISENDWDVLLTADDGDSSYIDFITEQHALDNIPAGVWSAAGSYNAYFDTVCKIEIDYAAEASTPDFDYHGNAPTDNVTSGDEVADNITLSTLACMYANENLEFDVQGESGALIDLRLVNSSGETLESISDGIRTNSHYYWQIDSLSETYSGFVRVKEDNYGLTSPWVCIQAQIDSTQENLNIYAESTEYPQYGNSFGDYVVERGDLMFIHWKTNIDVSSDNMTDLRLEIYNNGDNVTAVYSETFETLAGNYYMGTDNNTYAGLNWRFAVFTPKTTSGQNTYGGLVQSLNIDFVPDNKGYLQSMITSDIDGEVVTTHSAYWYLTSAAEGIAVEMLDNSMAVDQEIGVNIAVGRECNIETYLRYVDVSVVGTSITTSTFVIEGDNELYLDAVDTEGDYTLQVELYDSSITSYRYIYQLEFSVTESGTPSPTDHPTTSSDIWDWISDIMERWHLNTTGGHWLLIIIGMGMMLIIGYKTGHKTVGLAGALLILALGVVVGWLDWWWIILLALGAGFTIWQAIRSKASGSGAG